MLYEAVFHVRIGDARYRPGEVIDGALTEEQVKRLEKLGAVREVPGSSMFTLIPAGPEKVPGEDLDAPAAAAEGPEDPDREQEEFQEAEAPEIDVTEGIGGALRSRKQATHEPA